MGWNDERGYTGGVIPGLGLSEVFGVRESKVNTLQEVKINVPDNSHIAMSGLKKGDTLKGSLFAESLEPLRNDKNTKVLARLQDGTACIVSSTYGKGQTMFVGSFLALANSRGSLWDQSTQRFTVQDSANRNTNKFLLGLVKWANVERLFTTSQAEETDNPMVIRLHEHADGYLLYVLNHGRTREKLTIKLNVSEKGDFVLEEMIQKRKLNISANNKTIEITTGDIDEKEAEIWNIRRVKK